MSIDDHRVLARQEAAAVATLVAMGVRLSPEPQPEQDHGCGCSWHIVNTDDGREDGSNASALLHYVREGYLGQPTDLVMHPVLTHPVSVRS